MTSFRARSVAAKTRATVAAITVFGLLSLGMGSAHAVPAAVFSASTSQSPDLGLVKTSTATTVTVTMTASTSASTAASPVSMVDPVTGNAVSTPWTLQLNNCGSKSLSANGTCTFNIRFNSANKGNYAMRVLFAYTSGGVAGSTSLDFSAVAASLPGIASSLSGSVSSHTGALITWRTPSDNGNSALTGYRLNVTNSTTNAVTDFSVPADATSYPLADLTLGTTYALRLYAINAIGESLTPAAAGLSFTLPTPSAPTGLQASDIRSSALTLSWNAVSGFVDGYKVQISTTGYAGPYDDVTTTTDTTYKFTDLQPETGYFFKVFAYNNSRNGTESVVAVRTRDALPQAPTDFAVTDTTLHSVSVSWTAPLEDVTGYVVETSEDGTSWDEAGSTDGAETTFTLVGLDPDSHFFIRVHAFNTNGDGLASSVAYVTTVSGKPNPVQNLSATTVGESSVQLAWDEPQPRLDVDLPTTGYLIQSRSVTFTNTGFDATDWEDIQQVGSAAHNFLVTQITPCVNSSGASDGCPQTEYRVLALSEFGQSESGDTVFADPVFLLPSAPLDVQATAVAPGSVTVAWSPSSDGSSPVTGYTVHYSTDAADLVCEQNEFGGCDVGGDTVDTTDTAITIDNLDPDTTYYFVVIPTMASTAFGDIPGPVSTNTSTHVPADISAVTGVTVSDVSARSFTVTWDAMVSYWGATTYSVQVSTDDGDTWTTVSTTKNLSATVTELTSGRHYLVSVVATDVFVTADASDESEVTTVLEAASNLRVEGAGENYVTLRWDAPAAPAVVSGYHVQSRTVTFSEVNGENTSDWETIDDSDGTSFTVSDIAPCVVPLDYASFDPYCGNTEYRVVAFNDDTEASGSNIERFTPNFALPSATLDVQATAVAPGSVTVAWSPSSDGSSPVTGYTVHYSTDAADLVCEQNEFGGCDVGGDTVDTTDTAITIDNLDPDTTYYFVVIPTMASTAFGDIPGPVSTNTSVDVPGVVSAPSDVAVSGVTFSSVTVSWTESESNFGPITYTVQISDDGGDTWQDVLDTETPTATIQNLPDGVAYVVQVIARDAYSESEPSDTVEFRLKSRAKPAMPTVTEFSVDSQVGSISFETEDDTGATNVRYEATVYEDFPGGRSLGTVTCDSENLSCEIDGALTGTPYRILMRGFADGGHVQAPWYLHIPAPLEISVDSGVNVQQDDEITVEVTELRPGANAILKVAGRAQTVVGDEDGYASLSFTARGIGQKRVTIKQGSRQASDSVWVVALVTPRVVKPGRPTTLRVKGAKPGSEITLVSSLEDDRLVVASRTGKASFRVTVPTAEDTLDYSVLVDGAEFFSGSLTAQ